MWLIPVGTYSEYWFELFRKYRPMCLVNPAWLLQEGWIWGSRLGEYQDYVMWDVTQILTSQEARFKVNYLVCDMEIV
jgi:hypothetical protein